MSWTSPRTWASGETLTAALLNTHIRDNLNATAPAAVAAKGDIVAATAANTIARVAVGSNGAIVVADSAATPGLRWSSTGKTASGAIAINVDIANTLTAAANNDSLIQQRIIGVFAKGALTGLDTYGLLVDATNETVSGAGTIANAYAVYITPPTIGTNNAALIVSSGKVHIGDTSNAKLTTGLTINQGAATDEILAFKKGSLAHGITTYTETDTAAAFTPGLAGGLDISGYATGSTAFSLAGIGTTEDTTKSTAALAAIVVSGGTKSGTGYGAMGANANIVVFRSASAARFILDADGDSHQDVGTAWTNFDDHADAELLTALSVNVSRPDDPIRQNFREFLDGHRETLERARLVTFNDDGHHFVNMSKLAMLLTGAVRQLSAQIQAQAAELGTLRATVYQLTTGDAR